MVTEADFLVIGSGMAGLNFALKAAKFGKVVVVTKKEDTESNTNYAQGGIASVFGQDDSHELHMEDTLRAGAGLCDPEAVRVMVEGGPRLIQELINLGIDFSRAKTESQTDTFDLGMEGGHSKRRIVHAKDHTGREIESVLVARAKERGTVEIYQDHIVVDLVVRRDGGRRCWGAYALETETGSIETFLAKATLLATGGIGQVYLHTTNPAIATCDGIAMAYRAGAQVANLEFVQFHPTALYQPDYTEIAFLISEAVRGEGGVLRTRDGRSFMERYHELKDLAPRDVVARAIDSELKRRGEKWVYLDLSQIGKERIKERFPHIYSTCLSRGFDLTKEPIPVVPAAHYICGGVLTDLDGRTSLNGLYATGETACTRVHGANRLASNSLLEALVFAERACARAKEGIQEASLPKDVPELERKGGVEEEGVILSHDREELKRLMWDYVGIVRSDKRLLKAKERVGILKREVEDFYSNHTLTRSSIELRNMVLVAELIIKCALQRQESRGLHYNVDHPEIDEKWRKDTMIKPSNRNPPEADKVRPHR